VEAPLKCKSGKDYADSRTIQNHRDLKNMELLVDSLVSSVLYDGSWR
jgi:hypothetical protein